ncbi:hypothetical protein Q9189_004556 [Teloschistes chrysophthalmus]
MASAARKTFSVPKTIPTAVSGDILEAVALGQRPWYERFRGQHNEHLHVDVRFDGEDAMARCSMFALIGVLSVISVAEVHKVEVQKVQVQKVQVQKFQVQKVEVPQIGVQAARVQKVDVGRLLHISIIVGIVHLVDWRLLLNPPAFIAMSSLDRQNLTFTGKRKDDAESTDQAPKRAKNMGRPPILTESQKCKLVRLYLFTNLDVDGIGKLLGFRHKTPRKRTLQNILRETLNDGYHLFRPKNKVARKNRLLQVAFTRPDKASDSSSQQSPRFRIITPTTAQLTNSGSYSSNSSGAIPSGGISEDSPATCDATGFGMSTHDDDPDWINLVHWDEDYVCQQTFLQEASDERDSVNEDDTQINKNALAMPLPLSTSQSPVQLSYTIDDLLDDAAEQFFGESGLDLDEPFTDHTDSRRPIEDPVPCTEMGRSSTDEVHERCPDDTSAWGLDQIEKAIFPNGSSFNRLNSNSQTQCIDSSFSMTSYGGISSVIQQLSNCSSGHKRDIMYAFRAIAGSHRSPADYNFPDTTTICEDMVQDWKNTLYEVPCDGMVQNSEVILTGLGDMHNCPSPHSISDDLRFEILKADGNTWNLFGCAAATADSFTEMSIKDIMSVLTKAIRDPSFARPYTESFELLRSNDGMDRFGNTLLHLAASHGGNYTILNALMTKANMHRVNSESQTFMHLVQPQAIGDGMPILVQTLERLGFSFSQRDYMGRTCIHVLLYRGAHLEHLASYAHLLKITNAHWSSMPRYHEDPFGFRYLTSNGRKNLQPVWMELQRIRCECGPADTCRRYRKMGVNEYDCNGETELLKASRENDPSLSQDYYDNLIANGANVHYRSWLCETPLILAVKNGNVEATRALLRYHANVHARDHLGRGILTGAEIARKTWPKRYTDIIVCEILVIDAGAVNSPTVFDEWELKADNF